VTVIAGLAGCGDSAVTLRLVARRRVVHLRAHRPRGFTSSVFVMRSDGTCQTAVLPTAGGRSYSSPAWRPHTGGVKPKAC